MKHGFSVEGREIGPASPPFIVAEMSGNHNQSLDRALAIVEAAANAGAHGLKIQTYTADTMTFDSEDAGFSISDPESPWCGFSLHRLYQEAHTPWEWHKPIFEHCRKLGLIGFSSPFDSSAVDLLESLATPLYKIASFELTDLPLIRRVAKTAKPMVMSTGMATAEEIGEAVETARGGGCRDLVLLKCTSTYPATPETTNIATIPDMRARFGCQVGLSDHTLGIGVAVASVALGATVIEKHFTLSRADGGVDSTFSMEPHELQALVAECDRAWQAIGRVSYGASGKEKTSLRYRRSLYIAEDMKAGDILTEKSLRIVRPSLGLPPKHYDELLGRRLKRDVKRGTPLTWELLA